MANHFLFEQFKFLKLGTESTVQFLGADSMAVHEN